MTRGAKVGGGVAVVVVVIVIVVLLLRSPASAAPPPPETVAQGEHYATLRSAKQLFAHADLTEPLRTLPAGTKVKVYTATADTLRSERLFNVRKMNSDGVTLDTGENSRGYLYLSAAELS